jgi:large subunit ribosomal protein L29
MMKPNEVRNLTVDEIEDEVRKAREELLDLRFQASMGQASNSRRIRAVKRNVARMLTIATEKRATDNAAEKRMQEA